jgi:hypothetical protein
VDSAVRRPHTQEKGLNVESSGAAAAAAPKRNCTSPGDAPLSTKLQCPHYGTTRDGQWCGSHGRAPFPSRMPKVEDNLHVRPTCK